MVDLSQYKIEIFSGINDLPIAPTASSGQNISYNNFLHNQLITQLQSTIDTLTSRIIQLENQSNTNVSSSSSSTNADLESRIIVLENLADYSHSGDYSDVARVTVLKPVKNDGTNTYKASFVMPYKAYFNEIHFKNCSNPELLNMTVNDISKTLTINANYHPIPNFAYLYITDIDTVDLGDTVEFSYTNESDENLEIVLFYYYVRN